MPKLALVSEENASMESHGFCFCSYNWRSRPPASSQIASLMLNINYKLFSLLAQAFYQLALTT